MRVALWPRQPRNNVSCSNSLYSPENDNIFWISSTTLRLSFKLALWILIGTSLNFFDIWKEEISVNDCLLHRSIVEDINHRITSESAIFLITFRFNFAKKHTYLLYRVGHRQKRIFPTVKTFFKQSVSLFLSSLARKKTTILMSIKRFFVIYSL